MSDTQQDKSNSEDGSSILRTNALISVTDVFGLGAIAKSDAGKEVIRALGGLLGSLYGPLDVFLRGRAENSVRAHRLLSEASAEAKAALVRAEGQDLLIRAQQRFLAVEGAKQVNLECVIQESVETLDREAPTAEKRAPNEDWVLKWLEGAQHASTETMRTFWARVMCTQVRADKETVSAASMSLLSSLDQDLGKAFEPFVVFLGSLGCFPWHSGIVPDGIDHRKLKVLQEIGLIESVNANEFGFREVSISFGGGNLGLKMLHGCLRLTQRGHEIALAVFGPSLDQGPLKDRILSSNEQARQIEQMARRAIEVGPRPIGLRFTSGTNSVLARIDSKRSDDTALVGELLEALRVNNIHISDVRRQVAETLGNQLTGFFIQPA